MLNIKKDDIHVGFFLNHESGSIFCFGAIRWPLRTAGLLLHQKVPTDLTKLLCCIEEMRLVHSSDRVFSCETEYLFFADAMKTTHTFTPKFHKNLTMPLYSNCSLYGKLIAYYSSLNCMDLLFGFDNIYNWLTVLHFHCSHMAMIRI